MKKATSLNPAARFVFALVSLVPGSSFAQGPQSGSISGTVDKPEVVGGVVAVDRATGKKYPGKFDSKTGIFSVGGLPLGAAVDCVIDFQGARLEGVNLKVPRSDYEEEQPLSAEDIKTLGEISRSLNKFENQIDVLAVSGNIQHAAVVLLKLRTTPFYESKPGEMIWRLELWHYERPEETWVKTQDELFTVFYRERLQKSVYDKKSLTLDARLGGLKPTRQQPAVNLGKIDLPSAKTGIRIRNVESEIRSQSSEVKDRKSEVSPKQGTNR
jgi:hypothetical protein